MTRMGFKPIDVVVKGEQSLFINGCPYCVFLNSDIFPFGCSLATSPRGTIYCTIEDCKICPLVKD